MGCGCEFCGGARSRFAPGEDQPCVLQWNQLQRLIAEILERQMEFEKLKEVVARLEEERRKPGTFDRRELNRQLRSLVQDREARL